MNTEFHVETIGSRISKKCFVNDTLLLNMFRNLAIAFSEFCELYEL